MIKESLSDTFLVLVALAFISFGVQCDDLHYTLFGCTLFLVEVLKQIFLED